MICVVTSQPPLNIPVILQFYFKLFNVCFQKYESFPVTLTISSSIKKLLSFWSRPKLWKIEQQLKEIESPVGILP